MFPVLKSRRTRPPMATPPGNCLNPRKYSSLSERGGNRANGFGPSDERHMRAIEFDLVVRFMRQAARRMRSNNPVIGRPESAGRNWRLFRQHGIDWRGVHLMSGDPFVEPPCIVRTHIARKGAAQGHNTRDTVRREFCIFAR